MFGTSTLYHLVNSPDPPTSITILDRSPYPPKHAASTDINKIIRADYSSPFYMDLAHEALDAWSAWPELKDFYHQTGWINFHSHESDIPRRIRENYRTRGNDPTQTTKLAEVQKSFDGVFNSTKFEDQDIDTAYRNPQAGWCNASAATAALLDEAIRLGGNRVQYRTGTAQTLLLHVENVAVSDESGETFTVQSPVISGVRTDSGETFTANKILLATGAWTSSLLSSFEDMISIVPEQRIERQLKAAGVCVAHYAVNPSEEEALRSMPITIYGQTGDCQPPAPHPSSPSINLLKYTNARTFTNTITTVSGNRITRPPSYDQTLVPEWLKRETEERLTSKLLPQCTANKTPVYWRQCWDAVTPTQDHLICQYPGMGGLYLAVGGSLHSYKFLPIIGRYVKNMLEGKSNGKERDERWGWKSEHWLKKQGQAHKMAWPEREIGGMPNIETKGARL